MNFETLYNDCCRAIGDLNKGRLNEVKAAINMVYLDEMLGADPMRPWFWLRYLDDSIKSKIAGTVVSISKAAQAVMVTSADTYATGDIVSLYSVTGMSEMNYRTVRLTRNSSANYNLADLKGTAVDSSAFVSAATGGTVTHRGKVLSNKVRSIISVNWQGYNNCLEAISEKELEGLTSYWDINTSLPTRYQHLKYCSAAGVESDLLLWFYGADAAYNMRLWQELSPEPLSATTDVPLMPAQFHPAIEAGVITRLGENKTQVEAGVIWPQLYQKQIQAMVDYNRMLWKQYEEKRGDLYLL
jgi:hypothetical protein